MGQSWEFSQNQSIQIFTVPCTCRYKLEVWGKGYGRDVNNFISKGGYSVGERQLNKGDTLYVYTKSSADIRYGGQELNNRIIVAGAAGQSGQGPKGSDSYSQYEGYQGGNGGGLKGEDGKSSVDACDGGYGGTQVEHGKGGYGRSGSGSIGTGGEGYFNGGFGGSSVEEGKSKRRGGAGGGSGYVGGVENGQTITGGNNSSLEPFARITMLNSNPSINGADLDLGDKNTGFSISYQVGDKENDALIITEKFNGNVLRVLNNAPRGQDIVINITSEQLYLLPLNQQNVITIEVNDGSGGISYRNYIFRRTNTPPSISNTDKDLEIITALIEKYTINDMEGDAVNVVEKLDNTVLRTFAAGLGKEYTTTIDKDTWIKLKNGQHTYSIEATDSNNSKATRVFSFKKKENKIDFTLAKPFSTDIKASKILVTPSWELNGSTAKVEVCNNAFDANPTWEDITKQVLINRHYNFTNTAKTSDKWGVNIRIYIEKDQASSAEVSIKGFGGAFE